MTYLLNNIAAIVLLSLLWFIASHEVDRKKQATKRKFKADLNVDAIYEDL